MDILKRNIAILGSGLAMAGLGAGAGYEIGQHTAAPFRTAANQEMVCAKQLAKQALAPLHLPEVCQEAPHASSPAAPQAVTTKPEPFKVIVRKMKHNAQESLQTADDLVKQDTANFLLGSTELWLFAWLVGRLVRRKSQ